MNRQLADILVKHGIVQPEALDDPEGYDGCQMAAAVDRAAKDLHTMFDPGSYGNSAADVFKRLRSEIDGLKKRVLQRVILRVRAPYYCAKCGKAITRHAAQTEVGLWYHIGCLTRADSPHYHAADVRVLGEQWRCHCGHHNGPNMAVCAACGSRPNASEHDE